MRYAKDLPPTGANREQLIAYLERELTKLQDVAASLDQAVENMLNAWLISGITSSWFFNTITGNVDPGAGNVSATGGQMSSWTRININFIDAFQQPTNTVLTDLQPMADKDYIQVVNTGRSGGGIFQVNGAPTEIGAPATALSLPVTWIGGNSANSSNADLIQLRRPFRSLAA